ncbi:MAG TPA: DNA mismatch repair endonuclease MutL [Phycisphaerae bacterium]|nr:DNA mismatch repair endonuclease MutL [Phycisphaerae bacterium]
MGEIRLLPPALISRIAAGECIERPASVVKELVENALDAGARRVDIAILDGGRGLIQVTDDGAGMDAADLELAVTQHATSKIRTDEDLFNIHTLGFRGEALASIAAVARLKLISRRRDSDVGHELQVEAGQLRGPRPCSAPPGTTVEVRDLFYPVPARRKFLRTNQTEMGHITEQLARIALAQPEIAFTLKHQDRVTHRLTATTDRRQRIADFYGPELAAVLLPIRREGGGVLVEGLVAPPAESRGSTKWEYVFVNGRFVRDRFVSHAIKEAYRSLIDPSRSPVAFLFITIDPGHVDVNVHPTKVEVRWQDSNYVHGQVLAALRDKFLSSNLDHPLRTPREDEDYRDRVKAAMVDFFRRGPAAEAPRHAGTPSEPEAQARAPHVAPAPTVGWAPPTTPATAGSAPPTDSSGASPPVRTPPTEVARLRPSERLTPEPGEFAAEAPPTRALQIHNTYLVVETDDGLMLVDQHALHERILYEELRQRIAERNLESQRLLLPQLVRVPPDRLEALETHAAALARLGIELSPAGPQSVALQSFPTLLLERVDHERFVRDLLDLLAEQGARPNPDTLLHEVLDMMACKAAVKAGDPLTPAEIDALLQRRAIAERSSHCPHGRPTTLRLSLRDLERQFHRR